MGHSDHTMGLKGFKRKGGEVPSPTEGTFQQSRNVEQKKLHSNWSQESGLNFERILRLKRKESWGLKGQDFIRKSVFEGEMQKAFAHLKTNRRTKKNK